MRSVSMMIVGVVAPLFVMTVALAADGWTEYKTDDYGFSMQVPSGTQFAEKESTGGWGELRAVVGDITVYALGKLGAPVESNEIVDHGVKVTGIAATNWKVLDKGKDRNGWKWWETVEAKDGDTVVYGGYGIGPKGSYMMLMKTTQSDFTTHKKDYVSWYESIKLF